MHSNLQMPQINISSKNNVILQLDFKFIFIISMKISLPRNDLTQPIIKVNFDKNSNNLPNYY
jgi:hypothetical protein